MRYEILKEVPKGGTKKDIQYVVFDTIENVVIARYAKEADAAEVLVRLQTAENKLV
jgi:hypothetical protein